MVIELFIDMCIYALVYAHVFLFFAVSAEKAEKQWHPSINKHTQPPVLVSNTPGE